jgi:serine protease Do
VIARVKGSVLLILTDSPDGLGSGTGFVVSGSQVATCAHVVEGARRIQLYAPDGRRYRASLANLDRLSDVAVLSVSGSLPPPLSLGSYNQARDGDEVAVTGYPQMFSMLAEGFSPTPSTSRGSISAKRVQNLNGMAVPQLQTDTAINPGNSGGPLYSLRDGTVYGLAASLLSGSQGLNFASSVDALRRLLGR